MLKGIFFGNYFYGICAVFMAIEGGLQQNALLTDPFFYICLFSVTIWYYTRAYLPSIDLPSTNDRIVWYRHHKPLVKISQNLMVFMSIGSAILWIKNHQNQFWTIPVTELCSFLIISIIALVYDWLQLNNYAGKGLRAIGWLKPFLIGIVWAGIANVLPAAFYIMTGRSGLEPGLIRALYFINNVMFVAVLCIMFDVKDYAQDSNASLKTFVVMYGLRRTIYFILLPLIFIGFISMCFFCVHLEFSLFRLLINCLPFLGLWLLALSLHRRKKILYYLILIDGMMLVKSLCGISAALYF